MTMNNYDEITTVSQEQENYEDTSSDVSYTECMEEVTEVESEQESYTEIR